MGGVHSGSARSVELPGKPTDKITVCTQGDASIITLWEEKYSIVADENEASVCDLPPGPSDRFRDELISSEVCNFRQTLLAKEYLMIKWSFVTEIWRGSVSVSRIAFLGKRPQKSPDSTKAFGKANREHGPPVSGNIKLVK